MQMKLNLNLIIISTIMIQEYTRDQQSLVALILALFILALPVLALLIVTLSNIKKIIKSSILFYTMFTLLLLTKFMGYLYFAVSFIFISRNKQDLQKKDDMLDLFSKFYKNSMYASDFVICQMFLIMIKGFHVLKRQSLLGKSSSSIKKIWLFMQLAILTSFAVLVCLFNFNILDFVQVSVSVAILNFLCSILYIAIIINVSLTIRRVLTDSQILQRLKETNKRLFWFFFSRIISGSYYILIATNLRDNTYINILQKIGKQSIESTKIIIGFTIYFIIIFFSQYIPFTLSSRSSTIKLLQQISVEQLKESILQSSNSFIALLKSNQEEEYQKNISLKDFQITQILSETKNGFGTVRKGYLKGKIMVLRTFQGQFSKHILQDVAKQIQDQKRMNIQGLVAIKYSILQPKGIYLITDYFEFNLTKIIDGKKNTTESVRFMYQVTEIIIRLHKRNLAHGALKEDNIYLSGFHAKLAGYGLLSLKKMMSLNKGYSNKSIYTAPQLLGGKCSAVLTPTKQGDIYALGMIMFELFSGITVYRNLTIQEVQNFNKNKKRPKIPETVPIQLQKLMQDCWQTDPKLRPLIQQVNSTLKQYKNRSS